MAYAQRAIERMIDFVPGLLPLHPYWDHGATALIEDEELFTLDFRNAYPTLLYRVPTLEVMVDAGGGNVVGTYRFHRELLQHLQWSSGKRRWACKGVFHQFQLNALFATYPDAVLRLAAPCSSRRSTSPQSRSRPCSTTRSPGDGSIGSNTPDYSHARRAAG